MKHINLISEKDCCGCGVCREVCPVNAINLCADKSGFHYPLFDEDVCIDCGLCAEKCPVIHSDKMKNSDNPSFWGGFNKDMNIRRKSSSGGIFSVLAESVIDMDGVVVGAAFDRKYGARHVCISDKSGLDKLRGSKYVESRLFDEWSVIIAYLKQGKTVLFSGTPCQVAAARNLCRRWESQMIFTETVCFGVPSSAFFSSYLAWREKKAHIETNNFNFRYKDESNDDQMLEHMGISGKLYYESGRDPYMKAFYKNLSLRPSCYACRFKGFPRSSDFTLGDFWGIERRHPEFEHRKGVSLIVCNSEKGDALLNVVRDRLSIEKFDKKFAIEKNPMIEESAREPEAYIAFWDDFSRMKLEKLFIKYGLMPTSYMRFYNSVRTFLGKVRYKIMK